MRKHLTRVSRLTRSIDLPDVAILAGVALVYRGIHAFSPPIALVVLGILLVVAGVSGMIRNLRG